MDAFFICNYKKICKNIYGKCANQPPLLGRLPGFFLLRVDTPRSKLMR